RFGPIENGGMDSYSEHPSEFDVASASAVAATDDVTDAIGADERRMHVRAYNYWVSLLDGRDYPSIEDLEPGSITDFAPNSVLLDFTAGRDNPATPYVGTAIRAECGLPDDIKQITQVPSRSLLSRLTDHYLQIIANRAPIGFEAEFVNQRGHSICYRGILMPFSSDGDTIDFIYGVINWKDAGEATAVDGTLVPALTPIQPEPEPEPEPEPVLVGAEPEHPAHLTWEDGPLADTDIAEALNPLPADIDADSGLADQLSAARESADVCKAADGRSRLALYRALGMAYDFAIAAKRVPADYAEILEDAGVKAQARAPMTPIVKLVFGADYDKARLTEFAAALSYAERRQIAFGGFAAFVETQIGGLKRLVAEERDARRPADKLDDKGDKAREALRTRATIALADLSTDGEFALVVTRRNTDGVHEAVALIADQTMLDRAIRRAAA
ncbi:MAG: hypothetical protein Q8K85_00405, partial [Hyphomicrobium sp.]|nr:hypothetical protein [Hyphomicrobium sp.]